MRKSDLWVAAVALCAAIALALSQLIGGGAVETGSWGLSCHQEGQQPIGPADSKRLEKLGAAYVGSSE